jgi:hypothetical protein
MTDNDDAARASDDQKGSAESESWIAEQVRLITLEDGLS